MKQPGRLWCHRVLRGHSLDLHRSRELLDERRIAGGHDHGHANGTGVRRVELSFPDLGFARTHFSATFDSLATMALGDRVSKTLSWFDSGYGYAHRAVELVARYAAVEGWP